jgi:hypothetical protein
VSEINLVTQYIVLAVWAAGMLISFGLLLWTIYKHDLFRIKGE